MTPEMAGCILLLPNANTVFHLAATLVRAAAVAIPVGWQTIPRMAVSISPNSVYAPLMFIRGTLTELSVLGLKMVPSGTE